jgi:hypothetical protein
MSDNILTQDINVNTLTEYNNVISLPDLTNKSGQEITAAMWGINGAVIKEIANMNKVYSSKHGMFASVPIMCKDDDCAYKDVCLVNKSQRTVGSRCPMEIAAILSRYEQWCMHFEIDTSNDIINPEDLVDATLIKDLVNVEVQMLRAENKIALNGDIMSDTLLDIDKKCQPYYGKIVAPEVEFLMSLQDKKIKILNQLNATRKDKAADKRKESGSDAAVKIFQQIKELEKSRQIVNITDVEFDDAGEVIIEEAIVNEDGKSEISTVMESGGEENETGEKNIE